MGSTSDAAELARRRRLAERIAAPAIVVLALGAAAASVASAAPRGGAGAPAAAGGAGRQLSKAGEVSTSRPAVPATGYDEHWLFNANDGEPILHVDVARNGTFSFDYRPSYCGAGTFHIHGAFEAAASSLLGAKGYAVSMSVSGSCTGHGQSAGNLFYWSKARGISVIAKWPDSRAVQGEMIQTAIAGTARGNLSIDWGMSAS
ncbi:MAG TPA: hypothetical protein VMD59_16000 [Acidimicrobiales bacterium]|nr:hypothetical protein [Acidimicrobiales bacterium]